MIDIGKLHALIADVEAGAFNRPNGPRRYNEFIQRAENAGMYPWPPSMLDAFHKGDAECAAFLKVIRDNAEPPA